MLYLPHTLFMPVTGAAGWGGHIAHPLGFCVCVCVCVCVVCVCAGPLRLPRRRKRPERIRPRHGGSPQRSMSPRRISCGPLQRPHSNRDGSRRWDLLSPCHYHHHHHHHQNRTPTSPRSEEASSKKQEENKPPQETRNLCPSPREKSTQYLPLLASSSRPFRWSESARPSSPSPSSSRSRFPLPLSPQFQREIFRADRPAASPASLTPDTSWRGLCCPSVRICDLHDPQSLLLATHPAGLSRHPTVGGVGGEHGIDIDSVHMCVHTLCRPAQPRKARAEELHSRQAAADDAIIDMYVDDVYRHRARLVCMYAVCTYVCMSVVCMYVSSSEELPASSEIHSQPADVRCWARRWASAVVARCSARCIRPHPSIRRRRVPAAPGSGAAAVGGEGAEVLVVFWASVMYPSSMEICRVLCVCGAPGLRHIATEPRRRRHRPACHGHRRSAAANPAPQTRRLRCMRRLRNPPAVDAECPPSPPPPVIASRHVAGCVLTQVTRAADKSPAPSCIPSRHGRTYVQHHDGRVLLPQATARARERERERERAVTMAPTTRHGGIRKVQVCMLYLCVLWLCGGCMMAATRRAPSQQKKKKRKEKNYRRTLEHETVQKVSMFRYRYIHTDNMRDGAPRCSAV